MFAERGYRGASRSVANRIADLREEMLEGFAFPRRYEACLVRREIVDEIVRPLFTSVRQPANAETILMVLSKARAA
jgi:hypothetical protein